MGYRQSLDVGIFGQRGVSPHICQTILSIVKLIISKVLLGPHLHGLYSS